MKDFLLEQYIKVKSVVENNVAEAIIIFAIGFLAGAIVF